eukprot:364062-Chlamydomonas_euryale.AAC.4
MCGDMRCERARRKQGGCGGLREEREEKEARKQEGARAKKKREKRQRERERKKGRRCGVVHNVSRESLIRERGGEKGRQCGFERRERKRSARAREREREPGTACISPWFLGLSHSMLSGAALKHATQQKGRTCRRCACTEDIDCARDPFRHYRSRPCWLCTGHAAHAQRMHGSGMQPQARRPVSALAAMRGLAPRLPPTPHDARGRRRPQAALEAAAGVSPSAEQLFSGDGDLRCKEDTPGCNQNKRNPDS